ncbi:type II toxin-antitoxin system RelB/DinJ family antitoxin [Rhizobium leguminosarum]|uniref:type II toxin-antitoxin system RelB/DinJ family antitoxin n=1 Tax=Rhizobium leguminosarum TaxID=384 RepID=UPI001AE13848|nr:type II toxin-antitoxin system RelB/DinJ family antitoxin [Rhizobium leguminosarum]MBP2444108.1 addiction module RelB/DinJ family antitoxin [Rhizobium leguminosarum]
MSTQSSMLHVRIDDQLKQNASEVLANFGLTISDAVRILLTRIEKEGALPAGLTTDPEAESGGAKVGHGSGGIIQPRAE